MEDCGIKENEDVEQSKWIIRFKIDLRRNVR